MNNGWIKLYRKSLDNAKLNLDNDYWVLWTKLLLLVTHKEKEVIFKGIKTKIKPGQILTGRIYLAEKCNISQAKVERILKWLENEQQIKQQTTNKNRLITILKWKEYQTAGQQTGQQLDNNWTTTGQQVDTYKNDKNDKNDKKEDTTPPKISKLIVDTLLREYNLKQPDGDYRYDNLYPARSLAKKIKEQLKSEGNKSPGDKDVLAGFNNLLKRMEEFHKKNATCIKYINNNFNKIFNTIK